MWWHQTSNPPDEVESNQDCVSKVYQGLVLMRMNFKQAGEREIEQRVKKQARAVVLIPEPAGKWPKNVQQLRFRTFRMLCQDCTVESAISFLSEIINSANPFLFPVILFGVTRPSQIKWISFLIMI